MVELCQSHRQGCDSTEEEKEYKKEGMVASLEILLHAIYYLSTFTNLPSSLSGIMRPLLGSWNTSGVDHWVVWQCNE